MMKVEVNLGELPLATYRWQYEAGQPKAVVQIIHSISEHMGRYEELASFLNDYGYEVWGHDHPGHGSTGPSLGSVSGDAMSLLLGGIHAVREAIAKELPDVPVILLGHSMGSFLALRAAELDKTRWDGLILSGTNDRNPILLERAHLASNTLLSHLKKRKGAERALYHMILKGFASGIHLARTDWRTSDPIEAARYEEDPRCGFPVDHEFMKSLAKGLSVWYRKDELARLSKNLPILIISGTQDRIGNFGKGAAKLARSLSGAGLPLIYLRFYEGARHDLFWEITRQETMVDLLEFLKISTKERM